MEPLAACTLLGKVLLQSESKKFDALPTDGAVAEADLSQLATAITTMNGVMSKEPDAENFEMTRSTRHGASRARGTINDAVACRIKESLDLDVAMYPHICTVTAKRLLEVASDAKHCRAYVLHWKKKNHAVELDAATSVPGFGKKMKEAAREEWKVLNKARTDTTGTEHDGSRDDATGVCEAGRAVKSPLREGGISSDNAQTSAAGTQPSGSSVSIIECV